LGVVFAYIFAKKNRANIDLDELAAFRKLSQAYGCMTDAELASALVQRDSRELLYLGEVSSMMCSSSSRVMVPTWCVRRPERPPVLSSLTWARMPWRTG
jgi:hypothetical protein